MNSLTFRQVSVLDVGCGYGGLTGKIMKLVLNCSCFKHDSSWWVDFRFRNSYESYWICWFTN